MIGGFVGECPEPLYGILRLYKTASDWTNDPVSVLMDRGDTEYVETSAVAAGAEHDYQEFRLEEERSKARSRSRAEAHPRGRR